MTVVSVETLEELKKYDVNIDLPISIELSLSKVLSVSHKSNMKLVMTYAFA